MLSQNQVINKILSTRNTDIISNNNLTEDFFFNYKAEFAFILNHKKTYGNVPDKTTFINTFPDFDLVEVNEPDSYLLEQLYRDYNQTYMATGYNSVKKLLESGKVEEAIAMSKKIAESQILTRPITCTDLTKDIEDRLNAYIERTQDFSKFYIPTGFKELDAILGGWDRKEEYGLIVARTNTGKSFVAIKMAAAAACLGLNVGYYSGEMTSRKVGYRLDTILGHVSNGALIHGNTCVQMEYQQYLNSLASMKGSFKVITPLDINGPATVSALRAFVEREQIDILFIDQISLLEDERNGKTPVEKTANISRDIKNMQVMTQIPIIAVCQQNRTKNDDGSQDTTQIAQSDRLGQDCTVALFLDKDKEDVMKITLVKSRDSQNGVALSYHVDFNKGTWTYIPTENDNYSTEEEYENLEEEYSIDSTDSPF